MKEFEFYCDETDDVGEAAKKMFYNLGQNDPSSINYQRILERPKINWIQIALRFIVPNIVFILTIITFLKKRSRRLLAVISCAAFCIYAFMNYKKSVICAIKIYQRYAPASIRMKCRFEPSCSQYMILAIEKYGLLKGLKLGLNRLNRCTVGNGGFDFP